MSKVEQARKTWVGKSDEWLYERLANELSDKVQEIHRLLKELDEVKNLTIPAVVGRSEQLSCSRNITTCLFYKEGGKCSNDEYCRDQTT